MPKGQTYQLDRFNTVNGDIKVEKGASLIVCPDNDIHGDVTVTDNVIGGDLKIKGTNGTCTEQNNSVSGKLNSCP